MSSRRLAGVALSIVIVTLALPAAALAADDVTAPTGSFSINAGAALTNQAELTLSVAATDDASGVATVSVSNDGSTWVDHAYVPTLQWFLPFDPLVEGSHTVHVRWIDTAGNVSSVATDSIVLDVTQPTVTVELWDYNSETVTFRLT